MAYLYRHIRLDTNLPFYIGIGSDDTYKRAKCKDKRNVFWNRIVNKHPYRIDIVIDNISWEEACVKEKEFILLYGRKNINNGLLTNLNDGGEGNFGYKPTKEQREKNSIAHKGKITWNKGIPHTEEYKNKLSEIMKDKCFWKDKNLPLDVRNKISKNLIGRYRGIESPHFGKKRPKELVNRISKLLIGNTNMLGKVHSDETKEKISNANKGNKNWLGKSHSEETKCKISNANKGKVSPNKGKTASLETRLKQSLAKKGKKISEEHKRKIRIATLGIKKTKINHI